MIEQTGKWMRVFQCSHCGYVHHISLEKGKVKPLTRTNEDVCPACGEYGGDGEWAEEVTARPRWNRKWWHCNWTFDRFEVKK